ncbi:MAG: fumarylacetoacetate hydrolase family protein [Sphingomonadaceae bacterium]|nr:fumarylacetoacetate hydrolase family protein [Sphingomonadaceae bacterium]
MPLAVFSNGGSRRLGKVFGDALIDLSAAAPSLPGDVVSFLAAGEAALEAYEAVREDGPARIALAEITLHAPVPAPEKFLAIGMNYGEHAREAAVAGFAATGFQLWFNKQVSCINDPYAGIVKPAESDELDYEAELGVVIGRTCRRVPAADARSVIGGYLCVNDVSVRDWQKRTGTMTLGKSWDTHGPIGPWLTLDHEVADPMRLDIRLTVNGEQRQHDNSAGMIHDIYAQIAYLSTVMTLKPGDILSTGTPSGVGLARNPPAYLGIGDVVRVEIKGLGHIENRIVAED